nr:AbrB family transcriptional regulator [Lapidilactobacillus luobeiensis]
MMITIPASFKVSENTEYEAVLDENGIISFVPAHKNIYQDHPDYDFRKAISELDLGDNAGLVGKENVW